MRLHVSSKIEHGALWHAQDFAERQSKTGCIYFAKLERHGSRSADHSFDVLLSGDGTVQKHWRNPGRASYEPLEYAAHWDAWGWFFAYLFRIDPLMHSYADANAEAFHARTNNRFNEATGVTS